MADRILKSAGSVYVTAQQVAEGDLETALAEAMSRYISPWEYADRAQVSSFDLFPRLTRVRRFAAETARRLAGAFDVLRHGVPELEEDW